MRNLLFTQWPSRIQLKNLFSKLLCLFIFEDTFTSFFKDKKSQNSRNQVFFFFFLLMEGSRRPKNIRIRILNTGDNLRFIITMDLLYWQVLRGSAGREQALPWRGSLPLARGAVQATRPGCVQGGRPSLPHHLFKHIWFMFIQVFCSDGDYKVLF